MRSILPTLSLVLIVACGTDPDVEQPTAKDPGTAPRAPVDRFSSSAGHLMVRDSTNGLPAANAAVDFDRPPFVTRGLGPSGESVVYYNFDVQAAEPGPIYVFFYSGAAAPVPGQLNVVDAVPGDSGYSDFWRVRKVTVPEGYAANDITSAAEVEASRFPVEDTMMIVNCPIVPEGSSATRRVGGGSTALMTGWYRGMTVRYFTFEEHALAGAAVPLSPIFVIFNENPPSGGPASGFRAEPGSDQTHNVLATLPEDASYSPLWSVQVVDRDDFERVLDRPSAQAANILATDVATVNCPIASF